MDVEIQGVGASSNEIMPPSPLTPNVSRHGRSRHGGSFAKNKARGRGYSAIDDRELIIAKALTKVFKHSIIEDQEPEASNGWTDCEEILAHPEISALKVTLSELESLSSTSKPKFTLELKPDISISEIKTPSDYLIRMNPMHMTVSTGTATSPKLIPLSPNHIDVPKFIVYETSYANYPLILVSGGIKRAGGQAYLSFKAISLIDETELPPVTADVSIYIDLPSAKQVDAKVNWFRNESGAVLTEGDSEGKVDKSLWNKVVARRADIGVLFEDGQVKKEVPIGLRGKGVKPTKRGKAKTNDFSEIKALGKNEEVEKVEVDTEQASN